jgi:hypothetical protein
MQIMLGSLAFMFFWIPPQCGERMGLAITAILAAVASQLVVSSDLPVASEMTWFARIFSDQHGVCCSALFESAAVIYFSLSHRR